MIDAAHLLRRFGAVAWLAVAVAASGCSTGPGGSTPTDTAEPADSVESDSVDDSGTRDVVADSRSDETDAAEDTSSDPPRLVCHYEGTEQGVCRDSVLADTGDCREPEGYTETEIRCDDLDNDCDGTVDENCPCAHRGIGAGVCGDAEIDPDTGECDEPNAYESEESSCDKRDNDCDGTVDEPGDPKRFYRDGDGDGYGDPSESTLACSSPSGYVADNNDCHDGDSSVHSGAPEECGDGVDSNCSTESDKDDPAADIYCQDNVRGTDACGYIYDDRTDQRQTCCHKSSSPGYTYCRN